MKNYKNRLFIGGHRKTGTTLFASLLDGHPELFVYPYETHYWYSFYPEYIDNHYTIEQRKTRIKDFIFKDLDKILQEWIQMDKNMIDHIKKNFDTFCEASEDNTKGYFESLTKAVQEVLNPRLVKYYISKDTHSEIYANKIFELYPNAKFVNVVRDPRDNAAVIMNGWEKHYKYQYDCQSRLFRDIIDRGYLCIRMALENKKIYKDNYMIIKYEDLVNDTESTMKKISKFLDIKYKDFKLTPTFCNKLWIGNSFTDKKYDDIDSSRVDIYKDYLSEKQIKVLEYYFRDYMRKLGYKPIYTPRDLIDAVRDHYKVLNSLGQHYNKDYRSYE